MLITDLFTITLKHVFVFPPCFQTKKPAGKTAFRIPNLPSIGINPLVNF